MSSDPKRRADLDLWKQLAAKDLRGGDPDGTAWQTPAGLAIKPLYTAADQNTRLVPKEELARPLFAAPEAGPSDGAPVQGTQVIEF